jgi:anti-sigma regulatory factor (Ser/Thr protein kinase)
VTELVHEFRERDTAEVSVVRRAVTRLLAGLDDDVVADVLLCASELVTNAILHGAPPVRVRVDRRPDRIRVTVEDQGPLAPVVDPEPGAHGGMGLIVVDGVTAGWGSATLAHGKAVWADVPVPT